VIDLRSSTVGLYRAARRSSSILGCMLHARTAGARAGVRKVRFHDLRHTCASLLHEQGADARMIMEVLGHSSIRVAMDIYTFVQLGSQRSAFDRVGDALRGDDNGPHDDDGAAGVPATVCKAKARGPFGSLRRGP
jgi:hypothetical protein